MDKIYRTTQAERVISSIVDRLHMFAGRIYLGIANGMCGAFRNCCYLCRVWIGCFIYFILISTMLVVLRKLNLREYDQYVYTAIRQYVESRCPIPDYTHNSGMPDTGTSR